MAAFSKNPAFEDVCLLLLPLPIGKVDAARGASGVRAAAALPLFPGLIISCITCGMRAFCQSARLHSLPQFILVRGRCISVVCVLR